MQTISVDIEKNDMIDLVKNIVLKTKYHDYFKPFKGQDTFGTPQVMSMEEKLYRTVINILGITSREQAESYLKELKRQN